MATLHHDRVRVQVAVPLVGPRVNAGVNANRYARDHSAFVRPDQLALRDGVFARGILDIRNFRSCR